MIIRKFILFILVFSNLMAVAQNKSFQSSGLISDGSVQRINKDRGTISYYKFTKDSTISESDNKTWLTTQLLQLREGESFLNYATESDKYGFTHYKYKEFINGLPVEDGLYFVHCRNGKIISANGEYYTGIITADGPELTKEQTFRLALNYFNAKKLRDDEMSDEGSMQKKGELVIISIAGALHRAYKFDLYSQIPLQHEILYLDSKSGDLLQRKNLIESSNSTGAAETAYNGVVQITTDSLSPSYYFLSELQNGVSITTRNLAGGSDFSMASFFADQDNYWSDSVNFDNYATDAHFGAEAAYHFFLNRYNRNSYNSSGGSIRNYLHYLRGFPNALWDGYGLIYGDGDAVSTRPFTSLEIVAHEFTHAVTQNTANLIYNGESGALNESFSDIFGITIEYFTNPSNFNFLIGEKENRFGIPFRSMSNPNEFHNPDTYNGTYWNAPNEVHNNSGVPNYWYYLLVMGGSGTNDIGNNYFVKGIGFNDAIDICYRNLTLYLTPNATLNDARDYAIQSAEDIYGACSDQVVQTTNAWYAVGVGNKFQDGVVTGFTVDRSSFCSLPATIQLKNFSINANSFLWNFGDGTTSTVTNPSHTYLTNGSYNISLVASGGGSCSLSDTLIRNNLITVSNSQSCVPVTCQPQTQSYCCGIGIKNVELGNITNQSADASEGYQDFSCSHRLMLKAGDPIHFKITTGLGSKEIVRIWIDYNNDGSFNSGSELVFEDTSIAGFVSGTIYTPFSAQLNFPLRLRVADDIFTSTNNNACHQPTNGQVEDYSVVFLPNSSPPIADFTSDRQTVEVGEQVTFFDQSANAPSQWNWNLSGSSASMSTQRNPTVSYGSAGVYTVTLKANNSFGSDSITKTDFISVINVSDFCNGNTIVSGDNGFIYDSGGPFGNYQPGERCSLLISPDCSDSIILNFSQFNATGGGDRLKIFDGSDSLTWPIETLYGFWNPYPIIATSGKMLLQWESREANGCMGFKASWTNIKGSPFPPIANFQTPSGSIPYNSPFQFIDSSENTPKSWLWDFGDNTFSSLQNPLHAYQNPGIYTVKLRVENCIGIDSTSKQISVQNSPQILLPIQNLILNVGCKDSLDTVAYIHNIGQGDLLINSIGQSYKGDSINILAYDYLSDSWARSRFINALNIFPGKYRLTFVSTPDSNDLKNALVGKDCLVFLDQDSNLANPYSNLRNVVHDFAEGGGRVIICGTSVVPSRPIDLGLFNGQSMGHGTSSNLDVISIPDPLTQNVSMSFPGPLYTRSMAFTNNDKVELVAVNGEDVVAYRKIGLGDAVYCGFTFVTQSQSVSRILSNAITTSSRIGYIIRNDLSGLQIVSPGDSLAVHVMLNVLEQTAGTSFDTLLIYSNDISNSPLQIPVVVNVTGQPEINLSESVVNFGDVLLFSHRKRNIILHNPGCDSLNITSMQINSGDYSLSATNATVLPDDSLKLIVDYTPVSPGSHSDTLFLFNNSVDTFVVFNSIVNNSPIISVEPDSFHLSMACSDSTTISLMVHNPGTDTLHFTLSPSTNTPSDTLKILTLGYVMNTALHHNIDSLLISGHLLFEETIFTGAISALGNALAGMDVFLLPDQLVSQTNFFLSAKPDIDNFIAQGGTVIICGSNPTYPTRVFDTGLFSGNYVYYSSFIQNGLSVIIPTDPIVNGVPPVFSFEPVTSYFQFNDTDIIRLVTYQNFDVVSYRKIGKGKAVFLGFNYSLASNNSKTILLNALRGSLFHSHMFPIPDSAFSILPSDSMLLNIPVNSFQPGGNFTGALNFESNDPANSELTVKLNIDVSGNPSMALSDTCLFFHPVQIGQVGIDSLVFYNIGCDSLHVVSISSNLPEFTISPTTFAVGVGTPVSVQIQFQSLSVGTFDGELTINSDDVDSSVCVHIECQPNPHIDIIPNSISISVDACSPPVDFPVSIINNGSGPLNYHITNTTSQQYNDTVEILALTYGVDLNEEYPNTKAAISAIYPKNHIIALDSTPSIYVSLQYALTGKNVLLLCEQEGGATTYYPLLSTIVMNFMYAGGTVIVCGSGGSYANRIFSMGLFNGSYFSKVANRLVGTSLFPDSILTNIPTTFVCSDATYLYDLTNPDIIHLATFQNHDVVSYRNFGKGKVVLLGFDYYSSSYYEKLFVGNAVRFSKSQEMNDWIDITPSSGSLQPGDTGSVSFTFYTDGLSYGQYHTNVVVESNDSLNPYDTIPCTLSINDNVCPDFSYNIISDCSDRILFRDISRNQPTSRYWDFGDGGTSTDINPVHDFSTAGYHTISLTSCNALGCQTETKSIYIPFSSTTLLPSCSPQTTAYCCGIGIYCVDFNTLHNVSNDGSAGYEDFSCDKQTTLIGGRTYPIIIQTNTSFAQTTLVWIDYNNDGVFDNSSEVAFQALNQTGLCMGNVLVPGTAILNTPLRMRIGSEYGGPAPDGCSDLVNGQYEDYTVIVQPDSLPPIAGFDKLLFDSCAGSVDFNDTSINSPQTWLWQFGDGDSSVIQNPSHQYDTGGTYVVTLDAGNAFGHSIVSDSITVNPYSLSIQANGVMATNEVISFSSNSVNASTWLWDFGDGTISTLQNPTHIYSTTGNYLVSLSVTGPDCNSQSNKVILILTTEIENMKADFPLIVYPNPFNEGTSVYYHLNSSMKISADIINVFGEIVSTIKSPGTEIQGDHKFDIYLPVSGIYFLRVKADGKVIVRRIIHL